jgi:hypothetical protein
VEQELAKRRTPRLLCLLGDLTNTPALFDEAWELSGRHFSLAKRMLGNALVRQKQVHAQSMLCLCVCTHVRSGRSASRTTRRRWPSTFCTPRHGSRWAVRTCTHGALAMQPPPSLGLCTRTLRCVRHVWRWPVRALTAATAGSGCLEQPRFGAAVARPQVRWLDLAHPRDVVNSDLAV